MPSQRESCVYYLQGWSVRQIAAKKENAKIRISLPLLSQLFLKYACMLDILIPHFLHMEFSDNTFLILLNFWNFFFFNELDLTSFKSSAIKWFFLKD